MFTIKLFSLSLPIHVKRLEILSTCNISIYNCFALLLLDFNLFTRFLLILYEVIYFIIDLKHCNAM